MADEKAAAQEERRLLLSVATLAGFGCNCAVDCAYAIVAGPRGIGLPRVTGAEALERFERLVGQTRIANRVRFATDSRYWRVNVSAPEGDME